MTAFRGILPPVSDHPPSRDVHLDRFLLVLSALYSISSCTDQRCELYRRCLCLGQFRPIRRRFRIDNNMFCSHRLGVLCNRHSIRSNKTPAWSQRTWQRHVTTAVSRCISSTSYTILFAWAAFSIPPLISGNSYTGPAGVDNGDACKCNTVLYNLISACDACQGASWILCVASHNLLLNSNIPARD